MLICWPARSRAKQRRKKKRKEGGQGENTDNTPPTEEEKNPSASRRSSTITTTAATTTTVQHSLRTMQKAYSSTTCPIYLVHLSVCAVIELKNTTLLYFYFTFLLPGVVGDADPRQRRGSDHEVDRQPPARVRQLQLALVAALGRRQPVGARLARVPRRRAWASVYIYISYGCMRARGKRCRYVQIKVDRTNTSMMRLGECAYTIFMHARAKGGNDGM